jgi:hypothetical protein
MLDYALRLKHIIQQLMLQYIPGADRELIAIWASGLEMPIAYHHVIELRLFVDIVGVLRYSLSSSSSPEMVSMPKSSRVEKRLSCILA